jgi:hypothetical protein
MLEKIAASMTKKKLHPVIHHGIHKGIPFGLGTATGVVGLSAYLLDKITEVSEDVDTIQACIEIIQSILP